MKKPFDGKGPSPAPLLVVRHLYAGFGEAPVLQDVSLEVRAGGIVSLVGPNGAGKTTVLKAVGGLIRPVRGSVLVDGEPLEALAVADVASRGVVYVPEGMSVFPRMTVLENLEVGAYLNRKGFGRQLEIALELFPELRSKRRIPAGALSVGQQRMVDLARGLMAGARLLLLDDPFLGLSPKITTRFCDAFHAMLRNGLTLFIAGQHVRRILNVADLAFLMEDGAITLSGPGPRLLHDPHLQKVLFGLPDAGAQGP